MASSGEMEEEDCEDGGGGMGFSWGSGTIGMGDAAAASNESALSVALSISDFGGEIGECARLFGHVRLLCPGW